MATSAYRRSSDGQPMSTTSTWAVPPPELIDRGARDSMAVDVPPDHQDDSAGPSAAVASPRSSARTADAPRRRHWPLTSGLAPPPRTAPRWCGPIGGLVSVSRRTIENRSEGRVRQLVRAAGWMSKARISSARAAWPPVADRRLRLEQRGSEQVIGQRQHAGGGIADSRSAAKEPLAMASPTACSISVSCRSVLSVPRHSRSQPARSARPRAAGHRRPHWPRPCRARR